MSAAWQQPGMINPNRHDRDEFLRALEEARRAAMDAEDEHAGVDQPRAAAGPPRSVEFLRTLETMAGKVKSYISAGILARIYADTAVRSAPDLEPPPPPPPAKSEHEAVVDELHLTPNLTSNDLARIRREFAKVNHPDRVQPPRREEATRRMTIANSLIDDALRGKKAAH
jgi:hypothetical protein